MHALYAVRLCECMYWLCRLKMKAAVGSMCSSWPIAFQGQVVTGTFSLKQATSCSCAFPCSQIVTQGQGRVRVQQLAFRSQGPVVTLKQAFTFTFTLRSCLKASCISLYVARVAGQHDWTLGELHTAVASQQCPHLIVACRTDRLCPDAFPLFFLQLCWGTWAHSSWVLSP
jgi:hypothetical protein